MISNSILMPAKFMDAFVLFVSFVLIPMLTTRLNRASLLPGPASFDKQRALRRAFTHCILLFFVAIARHSG